jgi:hypothetical protein
MKDETSRRKFLAGAGAAGAIGFAGCAGGGGSGGSGGGDSGGGGSGGGDSGGGGSGGGGSGGDSGGSTGGEATEVNITLAPSGWQGIVMDHIHNDTNILSDAMPSGYTANVQKSWEGAALFASGGPDFSTMSAFEASRLGVERGIDLAAVGKLAPLFMGWWTVKGSEFDPANSGGVQASIDMLANQNAQVGIGSWAGGDVPGYTTVLDAVYGYTFREGSENDFNTVTADYNAVPQLMLEGQLEAGGTSPIHGVARGLDDSGNPQHVELFQCASALVEEGIGIPPLNNLTCTQSFMDDNREAVVAYRDAWNEGLEWLFEDPVARIEEDEEEHLEQLGVNTMAQAEYLIEWGVNLNMDNEYPYVYQELDMGDEYLDNLNSVLETSASRGFIPGGWQDRVSIMNP